MIKNLKQNTVLQVSNLTKRYGSFTVIDNLCLDIKKGEIFGLLGPNGAGKTTTISAICGLVTPDSGSIMINGSSVRKDYKNVRHEIGYCPQNIVVWEMLTCIEQLEFTGRLYNIPKKKAREKGLELLDQLGLTEKKDKLAKTLSGGMQRRLNIALALVHEPQILILDEPQAGLDPQSRVLVRDFIRTIVINTTVIITTHDMDEAERLSDRVAIIDRGKLLVVGTPDCLKTSVGDGEILEIKISDTCSESIKIIMKSLPSRILNKKFNDGVLNIITNDVFELLPEIIQVLKRFNVTVEDMTIRKKTLEDVFIALTGRGLRE